MLHARESDISRGRPLAEIGLDSLMALELAGNLEAAFGAPVALSGSVGHLTVTAIADAIIAGASAEQDRGEAMVNRLAEQHLEAAPVADFNVMREAVAEGVERRHGRLRPMTLQARRWPARRASGCCRASRRCRMPAVAARKTPDDAAPRRRGGTGGRQWRDARPADRFRNAARL